MKTPVLSFFFSLICLVSISQETPFLNLEWEEVDIPLDDLLLLQDEAGDNVHTYRVYASIPEFWELQIIYGDSFDPFTLSSSAGFYQHPMGGPTSLNIIPSLYPTEPTLPYDSWMTIGLTDNVDNSLFVLPDFDIFDDWELGNNLLINDLFGGGVYITTFGQDPQNSVDENGRVLIAQVTTEGEVDGCANFQIRRLNPDGTIYDPPGSETSQTELYLNSCFSIPAPDFDVCYNDFDNSGQVTIADLLYLLSQFGCSSNCPIDVNGDDITALDEFLFFLTAFGTICPQE